MAVDSPETESQLSPSMQNLFWALSCVLQGCAFSRKPLLPVAQTPFSWKSQELYTLASHETRHASALCPSACWKWIFLFFSFNSLVLSHKCKKGSLWGHFQASGCCSETPFNFQNMMYLKPFKWQVWMIIALSVPFGAFVFFVINKASETLVPSPLMDRTPEEISLHESFWLAYGTTLRNCECVCVFSV